MTVVPDTPEGWEAAGAANDAARERRRVVDCPFCEYAGPSSIIEQGSAAYVIPPINPVVDGHVLVVPYKHVHDFASDLAVTQAVMLHAALFARTRLIDCNLITSRGEAATQTVKHLHVHLIPRVTGDGLHLPWTGQQTQRSHPPPPTHICHACGEMIQYGAHAHGCE